MKKVRPYLPLLLVAIGIALVCWPVGQKAFGWLSQRQLQQQWQTQVDAAPKKVAAVIDPISWVPTRIVIPDLNIDAVVIDGFDEAALRRGPAHDPRSSLPGQNGNCVIAAHRNVYGAWFAGVDQLYAGSVIQLITPTHTYEYQTVSITRVAETDQSVLKPSSDGSSRVTLITCTLPHSDDRLVVTAVRGESL